VRPHGGAESPPAAGAHKDASAGAATRLAWGRAPWPLRARPQTSVAMPQPGAGGTTPHGEGAASLVRGLPRRAAQRGHWSGARPALAERAGPCHVRGPPGAADVGAGCGRPPFLAAHHLLCVFPEEKRLRKRKKGKKWIGLGFHPLNLYDPQ